MPKGVQGFQKGHKNGGRHTTKNLLPIIREKALRVLNKRLAIAKELNDLPTVDLLRFASNIMPKDLSLRVSPDVQYVSQTPRPELEAKVLEITSASASAEPTPNVVDVIITEAITDAVKEDEVD